jgi:hypothetical protein
MDELFNRLPVSCEVCSTKVFSYKFHMLNGQIYTKNQLDYTCPGKNEIKSQWARENIDTIETIKNQNHKKRNIFSLNMLIIKTHWTVWWWTFPNTLTSKSHSDTLKSNLNILNTNITLESFRYYATRDHLIDLLKLEIHKRCYLCPKTSLAEKSV